MGPPDRLVPKERRLSGRLTLLALLLSGCALFPLSEADCRPASWQQRGYEDGYFGNPPQDLRLAQGCGRFGIEVAQNDYLRGWRDGHDEWDRLMGSIGVD